METKCKVKKVAIITNSTNYEPRAEKVGRYLEQHDCQVTYICSDFSHREKKKGRTPQPGHVYIDTIPYKRNLSVSRLYSQYDFARKAGRELKKQKYDLVYLMVPANSLARTAAQTGKYSQSKIVLDIIDLWPESLPVGGIKRFWPVHVCLEVWRRLRDDYLKDANLVLTECGMYQDILPVKKEQMQVMYWPKSQTAPDMMFHGDEEYLHIAYLGAINHIIDVEGIVGLLAHMKGVSEIPEGAASRKVKLHVIGDGESRDTFLQCLREAGIETEYHGAVYDETEKQRIFSICSYGLNMMKSSVCVGLTMKSIDYFCYGIPMINNIPGDTWKLIENYDLGINVTAGAWEQAARIILDRAEELQGRRPQIQKLYEQLFSDRAMEQVLERYLLPVLED